MMKTTKYYNLADDKAAYPDAWLYVVWSPRGPGKTYSALCDCLDNKLKFIYMKRTMDDVDLICIDNEQLNMSPWKPINRDRGTNIHVRKLRNGIANVYHVDSDGEDFGLPIGTVLSVNAIHKYKGFELSDTDEIIFDEFIPQLGERVNRKEGQLLLDFYMTVIRDRAARGLPETKMILLANATQIYCPITETLGIVDDIARMNDTEQEICYLEDRKILLHRIPWSASADESLGIYQAMQGTAWAEMAFQGRFAYNDFSRIRKIPLKNMICNIHIIYNRRDYYIYQHRSNGLYYMCRSRGPFAETYDMEIEADRRRFWLCWGIDLRNEISDGNMFFDSYSGYNLLFNFTKIYSV